MIDNGNGTVTDSNTGLTWKQCLVGQSGATCTGTASALNWEGALALDDGTWRVPNIKELQSIVDYGSYGPAVNQACFPGLSGDDEFVWSASSVAANSSDSWVINFKTGLFVNVYPQTDTANVRLVCDGGITSCQP
jgi:hypothetical protein